MPTARVVDDPSDRTIRAVRLIAEQFNVSLTAAAIRMSEK